MPLRRPCLPSPSFQLTHFLPRSPYRSFHTTPSNPTNSNNSHDYYATLQVSPNASAAAIKKQFYTLSKTHHPDLNPSNPLATTRFVQISEAYAVLSNPSKRSLYDLQTQPRSPSPSRSSSFSSSSSSSPSSFGARPAHGLSKRRTPFHGPPPSFFRNGEWGNNIKRRAAAASTPTNNNPSTDVPHFDRDRHFQTQQQQDRRRQRRRQQQAEEKEAEKERGDEEGGDGGWDNNSRDDGAPLLFKFLLVTGVLGVAFLAPAFFGREGGRGLDAGGRRGGGGGRKEGWGVTQEGE